MRGTATSYSHHHPCCDPACYTVYGLPQAALRTPATTTPIVAEAAARPAVNFAASAGATAPVVPSFQEPYAYGSDPYW